MAREKPRHAKHEAGLIIVLMCAQSSRAGVRGSASFCIFEFLVRAVWSDQWALPNRAFALRLGLE
jgi:hypothetical protein